MRFLHWLVAFFVTATDSSREPQGAVSLLPAEQLTTPNPLTISPRSQLITRFTGQNTIAELAARLWSVWWIPLRFNQAVDTLSIPIDACFLKSHFTTFNIGEEAKI